MRYDEANDRQKTPANRRLGGGGKTMKGNLKEKTGATRRETNVKTPSASHHRGGGSRRKGENQHEIERWHNPQSREEGTRLVENV